MPDTMDLTPLTNRVQKNFRKLKPLRKGGTTNCWRLYDRDIPEYKLQIDQYGDHVAVYDRFHEDGQCPDVASITEAMQSALQATDLTIHLKQRRPQQGTSQYQKIGGSSQEMVVKESGRSYLVNLNDYLDSGLFLDHRPLRDLFASKNQGKFLNLFAYTSAVSVAAALGGAETVSIDMSTTYIEWSRRNFRQNKLDPNKHLFLCRDLMSWLKEPSIAPETFDTIFLDPPTFSNSKRMDGELDITRDHGLMIRQTMHLLKPKGTLYFSCNKRKFKLDADLLKEFEITDITEKTIPSDFRDRNIHVCFTIRNVL